MRTRLIVIGSFFCSAASVYGADGINRVNERNAPERTMSTLDPTTRPLGPLTNDALRRQVRDIKRDFETYAALSREAASLHNAKKNDPQLILQEEWLHTQQDTMLALITAEQSLRKKMLAVWGATGHGTAITKHKMSQLCDHAQDVADGYLEWLDASEARPADVFHTELLLDNVNAIRTEYSWYAIEAIQRMLGAEWYHSVMIGNGDIRNIKLSQTGRETAYRAFSNWLDANRNELRWDSSSRRFYPPSRGQWKLPTFEPDFDDH